MIIEDMTDDAYDALEAVRATWVKTLYSSTPLHLLAQINSPRDSDAMRFGRALHHYVLRRQSFESAWAISPKFDRRTKDGKAAAQAFEAEAAGREVIDESEWVTVMRIAGQIAESSAGRLLEMCDLREVVVTGEIAGVECKARIDAMSSVSGVMLDIKTCTSASERAFTRSVVDYGYLLQFAFYRELARQNGMDVVAPIIVACEKAAPNAVALYALRDEDIDRMAKAIPPLVETIRVCQATGEWTGYRSGVTRLVMPEWAFKHDGDAVEGGYE